LGEWIYETRKEIPNLGVEIRRFVVRQEQENPIGYFRELTWNGVNEHLQENNPFLASSSFPFEWEALTDKQGDVWFYPVKTDGTPYYDQRAKPRPRGTDMSTLSKADKNSSEARAFVRIKRYFDETRNEWVYETRRSLPSGEELTRQYVLRRNEGEPFWRFRLMNGNGESAPPASSGRGGEGATVVVSAQAIAESPEFRALSQAAHEAAEQQDDPVLRETLLEKTPALAAMRILKQIQLEVPLAQKIVLVGDLSTLNLNLSDLARLHIEYLNTTLEAGVQELQAAESDHKLWIIASVSEASVSKITRPLDVIRLLVFDLSQETEMRNIIGVLRNLNVNPQAGLQICHLSAQIDQDTAQKARELLTAVFA
jgi:hypothetical protein